MQAFEEFKHMSDDFWAIIKYVSGTLGYTVKERRNGKKTKEEKEQAKEKAMVRSYSIDEINALLKKNNIVVDDNTIKQVKLYCDMRADLLNNVVRSNLMKAEEAKAEFEKIYSSYHKGEFQCKLPMNKQRGDKRQIAFFTAIINIITEKTIRDSSVYTGVLGFDDDPRGLVYVIDDKQHIVGASSRRFDGAYPCVINPRIVWEIKEYYYATTFGSRVADGVYETQLDGHEFRGISQFWEKPIYHVFFLDAYKTWWVDGKSYLCRIIDILNSGLVDEVIVGREVFTRWPQVLQPILDE
ncbi:MAG: hypothetical protein IJ510_03460 [Selenomonadales bacterium]|nr:hypothetical protein [Selenomonadales bacterium]